MGTTHGSAPTTQILKPAVVGLDAVRSFVDALGFNWIMAGTDAHAKNYSLLHAGSQTRLAPLYDLASALPYDTSKGRDLKLAMKIGDEYRLSKTDKRSRWDQLARQFGLAPDEVIGRVVAIAEAAGPAFAKASDEPAIRDLRSDLPRR